MPLTTTSPSRDNSISELHPQHIKLQRYAEWMQKHWETALGMKLAFKNGDDSFAAQLWFELTNEERQGGIWISPRDDFGLFTTEQRNTIKSSEFRQMYYGT